jgi:osmotically-inducible protein OsmY
VKPHHSPSGDRFGAYHSQAGPDVRLQPETTALRRQIEDALDRCSAIETTGIVVCAIGRKAILRGAVQTWAEREKAERLARLVPGVIAVENELVVRVPPGH